MKTITHKQASLRLSPALGLPEELRGGVDEIVDLYVDPDHRNKGLASALMQRICRGADTRGRLLLLQPKPFDDGEMSELELAAWYTKMGFEIVQIDPLLMARAPRQ